MDFSAALVRCCISGIWGMLKFGAGTEIIFNFLLPFERDRGISRSRLFCDIRDLQEQ